MKNYLAHRNSDLFDEAMDSFFRPFYMDQESTFMKTDIKETENNYVMDVEMPGFDKKDISLKFENGYVTVSAKKQAEDDSRYIRRERAVSCSRSYYMGEVDEKQIKAKYENGVLTVTIPKEKPEESHHNILIDWLRFQAIAAPAFLAGVAIFCNKKRRYNWQPPQNNI